VTAAVPPPAARPLQERRRSLAILPVSGGSVGGSQFSPRPVAPSLSAKDRLNVGLGNASDFVAALMGSKSPGPTTGTAEDHFWVPPTVWRKKRAQSLVPPKLSTDTRAASGELSHFGYHTAHLGMRLIFASAYRLIGRYRRSKHRKSMTALKPVADKPLRQLTLILKLTLIIIVTIFAKRVSRPQPEINIQQMTCHFRISLIFYVLNADCDR